MKTLHIAACTFLLFSVVSAPVYADIAPPDDYVETCTKDIQEVDGTSCVACDVSYEDWEICKNQYDDTHSHVCSTYGASFRTELWCSSDGTRSDDDIDAERAARVSAAQNGDEPVNNNTDQDAGGVGSDAGSTGNNSTGNNSTGNNSSGDETSGGGDDEESSCSVVSLNDTGLFLGLLLMLVLVRRR